jgi:SET domain-containing protein
MTEDQVQRLPVAAREQVLYYAYFDVPTKTFVLSGDDDRFTNHSDNPNTKCQGDCTFAVRDIQEGEEITNDYRELVMLRFIQGDVAA